MSTALVIVLDQPHFYAAAAYDCFRRCVPPGTPCRCGRPADDPIHLKPNTSWP